MSGASMSIRAPAPRLQLVVFGVLGAFAGLIAIGMLLTGIFQHHFSHGSGGRGSDFAGAAVLAIVSVLAVHRAHRLRILLRDGQVGPNVFARSKMAVRSNAPLRLTIAVLALTGISAYLLVHGLTDYSHWRLTKYTQAHGVPAVASIDRVAQVQQCGRYGCTNTGATLNVTLLLPVDGVSNTVVHVPESWSPPLHDTVDVIVDPKDPTYAELPGQGYTVLSTWVTMLALGVLSCGVWCLTMWGLFRRALRSGQIPALGFRRRGQISGS